MKMKFTVSYTVFLSSLFYFIHFTNVQIVSFLLFLLIGQIISRSVYYTEFLIWFPMLHEPFFHPFLIKIHLYIPCLLNKDFELLALWKLVDSFHLNLKMQF